MSIEIDTNRPITKLQWETELERVRKHVVIDTKALRGLKRQQKMLESIVSNQ